MENINILIVDDDIEIVKILDNMLKSSGYAVYKAFNGIDAVKLLEYTAIHLIIMDIMMPELDGLSAILKIREKYNIPIIIISAKSESSDKVLGLSIGADDYLVKPFQKDELIARVKSSLRRYLDLGSFDEKKSNVINYHDLTLDLEYRKLYVLDKEIRLTSTEYKIIVLLMKNIGKTFSSDEIFEHIWGEDAYESENTVMIHISRIRKKIEINPKKPQYLKVVWGVGYKIEKE